ncbi:unannotated protein [freshwater metagenome]|uniref:Unannotated protein n=1 Tax=freshwater metagenome TaxID=449393 RepID=A0A6J7DAV5_9ZZZZ|nr:DUF1295 domain-containing protein [Actinomycetota bacterium]
MSTNHSGRTRQRNGIAIGEGAIRKIFPAFVVLMWITTFFWVKNGQWTSFNTVLAIEATVICAIVFVNFVYVFNFGYAAALFVLNLTIIITQGHRLGAVIIGGLLMIYAIRLFIFVWQRYQAESFAPRKQGTQMAHKALPTPIKIALFVQTSTLMTFHAMTTYNISQHAKTEGTNGVSGWLIIGALILAQGLVIEALADSQKQKAKKLNGSTWVESGLFAKTRHPNYLGEILVQAGLIISGFGTGNHWYIYAAGILSPLYIIILMLSATTGGELLKQQKYGEDPQYRAYMRRSNPLLPRLRKTLV